MTFAAYKKYLPVLVMLIMIVVGLLLFDAPPPQGTDIATMPAAGTAEAAPLPYPSTATDIGLMLLKLVLVLGGICGLAWISLRWLLPRMYGSRTTEGRHIHVIEDYRLDPKKSLFLVEVRGEVFLLAGSEQGIQFISRIDGPLTERSDSETDPVHVPAEKVTSEFETYLRKDK